MEATGVKKGFVWVVKEEILHCVQNDRGRYGPVDCHIFNFACALSIVPRGLTFASRTGIMIMSITYKLNAICFLFEPGRPQAQFFVRLFRRPTPLFPIRDIQ
jgi:hypothetical protein